MTVFYFLIFCKSINNLSNCNFFLRVNLHEIHTTKGMQINWKGLQEVVNTFCGNEILKKRMFAIPRLSLQNIERKKKVIMKIISHWV